MTEPHEVLVTFGDRVVELRRVRGMSQVDLAVASGLDRVTISRVERGRQDLGVRRLVQLTKALECDASDLLPARADDSAQ